MRSLLRRAKVTAAWRRLKALVWAALSSLTLAPPAFAAFTGSANLDLRADFQGVLMVTDLAVSSGPAVGEVTLSWTAPNYTGLGSLTTYYVKVSSLANITNQAEFNAALDLSAFSISTAPAPASAGTRQNAVIAGLVPCVVYYFAISAADNGAPQSVGGWLRSVPKNFNVNNSAQSGCLVANPALAPYGVSITTTATTATVNWLPVTVYESGALFALSTAPAPSELSGYHVYRATAPTAAPWTDMITVSTATWSWQDSASGPQYYYYVRSENTSGLSKPSVVASALTRNIWVVAYDGRTTLEVPVGLTPALQNYHVAISSRGQDLGGFVQKSVDIQALRNGLVLDPEIKFGGYANLQLHYSQSGSLVSPSAVSATPQNLSVFWNNGSKWVQLYGKLDSANKVVLIQTPYLGQYQLRTAERTGAFSFNPAAISNRTITPNNDGKNDAAEFKYDNPQFSEVTGKIYDLKGKFVASMAPCPDLPECLMWDATAGGNVVPGGVYIYQIEAEGQTHNGTVIVIK